MVAEEAEEVPVEEDLVLVVQVDPVLLVDQDIVV
tara:strand:+ start:441 stop:542 length:102 start_codon:yes stop_codon:yes gene_type:complete